MITRFLAVLSLLLVVGSTPLHAAGEQIDWQVISSGGGDGASTNFRLSGTIGQTAVGSGASSSYQVYQGYWQDFEAGECCVLRGDLNNDAKISVSDLTFLVSFIFKGGDAPTCYDHGDVNGDTQIKVSDLTSLVSYIFKGGAAPAAC